VLTEFIAINLEKMGIKSDCTETVADAKHLLTHRHYDLCLTDMRLPDGNGLDLVKHIGFQHAGLPIAIMTAFPDSDNAVSALKAGAFDYLSKPIELPQLQALVRAALKFGQSNEQRNSKISLLGNSTSMQQVRHVLERMSQNQVPLLITGELGTGKESAARLIHHNSTKRDYAFIKVNCATLNSESAHDEFFGYLKNSPQDSKRERVGFLKSAKGGTLFLDSVDKLPLSIQSQLVDLIQDEHLDVRIISASHHDIVKLIEQSLFNQDFYYRINVMSLEMPALRNIAEDIPIIAQHLLIKISETYGGSQVTLAECAFTLCNGTEIKAEDLHIKEKVLLPEQSQLDTSTLSLPDYLENIEKQAIREALEKTCQNKTAAAKLLGVSFRTLRYRLAKLGLSKGEDEIDK